MLAFIFGAIGVVLDGVTELGHHAMFVAAGICLGIGINKLKTERTNASH